MKKLTGFATLSLLTLFCTTSFAKLYRPSDIHFNHAAPQHAAGSKAAFLEGNPKKPGLFTIRMKFPPGFVLKPHAYTSAEQSVVLKGLMYAGFGKKIIKTKKTAYPAGSFFVFPANKVHWGVAGPQGAEVQFYMIGPMKRIN